MKDQYLKAQFLKSILSSGTRDEKVRGYTYYIFNWSALWKIELSFKILVFFCRCALISCTSDQSKKNIN